MARMTTGKDSKQDYKTPKELIAAAEARFGKISIDLAADHTNKVADLYLCSPEDLFSHGEGLLGRDCLEADWVAFQAQFPGMLWDNCPFNSIPDFSLKHKEEMKKGAESLLLIPDDATKAYMANVIGHADVYRLVGRIPFKIDPVTGKKEVFPKDCCIAHYRPGNDRPKYSFWDWRKNLIVHTFDVH